jgi:hypothetical protein
MWGYCHDDGTEVETIMRIWGRLITGAFIVAAIYAVWVIAGRGSGHEPQKASIPAPDTGSGVKIVGFYARDGMVTEGGKTVLCYGVLNARAVRIDPPVEGVWPALNRCVEVRPKGETRYILTAEGSDGKAVSESITIHVGTDTAALPKILDFSIAGRQKDYAGKTVFSLAFVAQNAEEISIDPPVFPPFHGAPSGQFSVRPDKTTTYTLIVKGKNGHVAKRQLTIAVD